MAKKYENWLVYDYDEVTSTNDVIKDLCCKGGQKIAVFAKRQSAGRGRLGRKWQSLEGNLFLSLAVEVAPQFLSLLALICGLTLWQIIQHLQPVAKARIKWPNDVLLNGAKVCGILLEKGPLDYIIVGIGVNVAQSPSTDAVIYPTTSLKEEGIEVKIETLMKLYLQQLDFNLSLEQQKNGRKNLRKQWLQAAKGYDETIVVRQNNQEICGIFKGIDENGYLLLENGGKICQIRAGDVFYVKEN